MKQKNGFTLVELMAVLVILGVLLLMAMPSITNTFRNSKETEEEEYLNTLCLGVQSYMEFEKKEFGQNASYDISISTLKSSGYVRDNIKAPDSSTNYQCVRITTSKKCSLVTTCK